MLELIPVPQRHQADVLFCHKWDECLVVHDAFIHGFKGQVKLFGYTFDRVSSHENLNFGDHFILFIIQAFNRLLKFGFILLLDIPELVPCPSQHVKRRVIIFLFQQIAGFFKLFDETEEVNGLNECFIGSVSPLFSFFVAERAELFLNMRMCTLSMFRAWLW